MHPYQTQPNTKRTLCWAFLLNPLFYIQEKIMPRVAFFFGISIYMYLDDHGVPHCHAIYGDYAGSFSLQSGELMAGEIPPQQAKKIKDFILANQTELMEKWNEFSN